MKPRPRRPQILQLTRGNHAHFEQEQTQHPLEGRHKESIVVVNHLLALQPTDEANEDCADEKADSGVEQDLVEQLGFGSRWSTLIRVGELWFEIFRFPRSDLGSPALAFTGAHDDAAAQ